MRISAQGLMLIEQYEGFSAIPYLCPAGVLTIGYGHVIASGERFSSLLTQEEARGILRLDVRSAERAVMQLITATINQSQFDALVSFTFNVGAGALQRSRLRRIVNRQEHSLVPRELMRWVYARGIILKGLQSRRYAESVLYLS